MTEAKSEALKESIVAWYGAKTPPFAAWLEAIKAECQSELGEAFEPYPTERVHATILDVSRDAQNHNLAYLELRSESIRCNLAALEEMLSSELTQAMHIRFGGSQTEDQFRASRGRPRRERRFSLQADKVVLIGWPDCEHRRLGDLRRGCEAHGFLHRYHAHEADTPDRDCYLRLGLLRSDCTLDDAQSKAVEERMRTWLERHELMIDITAEDLAVVSYEDETLPAATSAARALVAS